jgi:hypothetical protein
MIEVYSLSRISKNKPASVAKPEAKKIIPVVFDSVHENIVEKFSTRVKSPHFPYGAISFQL